MSSFTRAEHLGDMINPFRGLGFRSMDLCNMKGVRLLLDACAITSEALWLHQTYPRCEGFSLEDVRVLASAFLQRAPPSKTLTYPGTNRFGHPEILTRLFLVGNLI